MLRTPFTEGWKHNRPVALFTPHCISAQIHTMLRSNSISNIQMLIHNIYRKIRYLSIPYSKKVIERKSRRWYDCIRKIIKYE